VEEKKMEKKIIGIFVCMLFIVATILPVVGSVNIDHTSDKGSSDGTDWWPMFRHDLQHSGYSTSDAPDTDNLLWSYTTGDSVRSSPAVVDGRVYIGSWDYNMYCLDADTGDFIWSYTTGSIVTSSPAIADGKIYFGSADDYVYCLDADSGDLVWNYLAGESVYSSPAVVDSRVYIGSYDNNVYCLDADTGDFIWSYTTGGIVYSSPAVVDGGVYIGSGDNNVYCLDADNGDFIWSYTTGDGVSSSPTVADGKVYAGSADFKLYCLDADTGDHIWNNTIGHFVSSTAVVDDRVYLGSDNQNVYCLDADTGDLIWSYTTGERVASSPAIADGKLYIGQYWHKVYCLDANNGDYIWSYTTEGQIYSSPAVADSKVYIGSKDGKVYCFKDEEPNHPPEAPTIDGPNSGGSGVEYTYTFASCDPDGDDIYYLIDWDDGTVEDWIGPYPSCQTVEINHGWSEPGTYNIIAKARDINDAESEWSEQFTVTLSNSPSAPTIDGPTHGKAGKAYPYTFISIAPNEDQVSYYIRWGDGEITDWTDFQDSGPPGYTESHSWDKQGEYIIQAKAKNSEGAVSEWSQLEVTIPRNRASTYLWYPWLLERFPLLERLLTIFI
jgi:outer membrane protein assembly factor BamB